MKVAGVHCNSVKSVECSEVESISTVGRSGGAVRETCLEKATFVHCGCGCLLLG